MEATLWESLGDDGAVRCHLCSHRCIVKPAKRGLCGVRENRSGILETLVYGQVIARHVDPIDHNSSEGGLQDSRDHTDGGSLAGSVGPQKTEDLPSGNLEIEMIDGSDPGEILGQILQADHVSVFFWVFHRK